jgi:hypothetical protein
MRTEDLQGELKARALLLKAKEVLAMLEIDWPRDHLEAETYHREALSYAVQLVGALQREEETVRQINRAFAEGKVRR